MAGKTQFEVDFGLDLSSPDIDVVRAVETAIEIEKLGKQFYEHHARASDPVNRKFMEFLAREEGKHIDQLERLRVNLKTEGKWIEIERDREIENVAEEVRSVAFPAGRAAKEGVDAVIAAIGREKEIRNFYLRLAENLKEGKGKEFFRALADWEQAHYEFLSAILAEETRFRMET